MKENNDTESKILEAAKKIFARDGFSGARIDEIAKEADINKAMIYYHFKSKEVLYQKIIDLFFQKVGMESVLSNKELNSREKLRQVIHILLETLSQNQYERCSLIAREMVSRGKNYQKLRDNYWVKDYKFIRSILEEGTRNNEFSLTMPLDYTVFLIVSMTVFYKISQVTYEGSEIYDSLYNQGTDMEAYINYILDKILNKL